jgi:hypothetical protein
MKCNFVEIDHTSLIFRHIGRGLSHSLYTLFCYWLLGIHVLSLGQVVCKRCFAFFEDIDPSKTSVPGFKKKLI